MKLSDLIAALTAIQDKHGDVDVFAPAVDAWTESVRDYDALPRVVDVYHVDGVGVYIDSEYPRLSDNHQAVARGSAPSGFIRKVKIF